MKQLNYDILMQKCILGLNKSGARRKLLMHACCAPCSSSCIERLKDFFDITIYFYNPNIDTLNEFTYRAQEQKRLCEKLGVVCIIEEYNSKDFYCEVEGLEAQPEGGKRCEKCFILRLTKTALFAKQNNYDYFTTTLTVSPLKNAQLLNELGEAIGKKCGVNFLNSDFKKKNGYLRSIELSREFGLYRQNYCGCIFSKNLVPN